MQTKFQSKIEKGTPLKDLEAIGKTIEKETMPPLRYLLMHRDARLTEAQKKAVLEWVKESRDKFILEQ